MAPLYLLFKDHKGWSVNIGGEPPSRPVASANSGQNVHLSEVVSQILEPIANNWKGGMEVISTPDLASKIDGMNDEAKELDPVCRGKEDDDHVDEPDHVLGTGV